jgi:flagellar hook-associated protein 3 FlgL
MRITTWMTQQRQLDQLRTSQTRVQNAQSQVSSGIRVTKPSDDPTATSALLRLQSQLSENGQRQAGINGALPAMRQSENTLGAIASSLQTARQAGLQANNTATLTDAQREPLASQVENALKQALSLANTQSEGRYLFAGTVSDQKPFPTTTYAGNDTPLSAAIGDDPAFALTVTGENLRHPQGGDDLFSNLQGLADAIRSGDNTALGQKLDAVQKDYDHVLGLRGDMGARLQYVTLTQSRLEDDSLALQSRLSELRDADLAESAVATKIAQNIQEATLAVIGQSGRSSLLDYLR